MRTLLPGLPREKALLLGLPGRDPSPGLGTAPGGDPVRDAIATCAGVPGLGDLCELWRRGTPLRPRPLRALHLGAAGPGPPRAAWRALRPAPYRLARVSSRLPSPTASATGCAPLGSGRHLGRPRLGTLRLSASEWLDAHPQGRRLRRSPGRPLLVAADLLAPRNGALVTLEEGVDRPAPWRRSLAQRRRQVRAYATWRVLRRARRPRRARPTTTHPPRPTPKPASTRPSPSWSSSIVAGRRPSSHCTRRRGRLAQRRPAQCPRR